MYYRMVFERFSSNITDRLFLSGYLKVLLTLKTAYDKCDYSSWLISSSLDPLERLESAMDLDPWFSS